MVPEIEHSRKYAVSPASRDAADPSTLDQSPAKLYPTGKLSSALATRICIWNINLTDVRTCLKGSCVSFNVDKRLLKQFTVSVEVGQGPVAASPENQLKSKSL
jgi:hypothetical protein